MRQCDSHEVSQLNEIKIDDAALNMIASWIENNNTIMVEQMPLFGGYAGGLEETVLVDTVSHLASFTTLNGSWHLDGPIHVRWGITTSRETLAVAAHTAAAISENTDLLIGNQYYPLSGPCTEMCLKEVAAQAMADTASGRSILSGSASAKGVLEDHTTGLEARCMAEAAEAAAGMKVSKVNEVLNELVNDYEQNLAEADEVKDPNNKKLGTGKSLSQCYNLDDLTPTDEYWDVYQSVKNEIVDML